MRIPAVFFRTLTILAGAMLLAALPSVAGAQNLTFSPYSGYRLGGSLTVRDGDLKLANAPFFGAQLDFRMRPDATGALLVDYQPTTLRLKEYGGPTEDLFDIGVWYFQGGGTLEVMNQSPAVPFVLGTMGLSWFDPGSNSVNADSEWGFSGIIGVGVKIPFPSGRMALRLQSRLLMTSLFGGGSLWCGTGTGCYVGVSGFIAPVQFDFGGALTFGGR